MKLNKKITALFLITIVISTIMIVLRSNIPGNSKFISFLSYEDKSPLKSKSTDSIQWAPSDKEIAISNATDVNFFGRVVDQYGTAVVNAEVVALPNNDPWGNQTDKIITRTDSRGQFVINTKAARLNVSASADGYYYIDRSSGNFWFAEPPQSMPKTIKEKLLGLTSTSIEFPQIFVLLKMGTRDPLYHSVYAKKLKPEQIVYLDEEKKHSIRIIYNFESKVHRITTKKLPVNAWSVDLSAVNGEIIEVSQPDKYQPDSFVAPLEGYKKMIRYAFDEKMTDKEYRINLIKNLFVKFDDGKFARLEIDITSGPKYPFVNVEGYYNLQGNRNTEYDPSIQVNDQN